MKKYLVLPAIFFLAACNSNEDQKSTAKPETAQQPFPPDTTTGNGLLSGSYEIVEYKKDNTKVELPKTVIRFTRSGEYMKPDGNTFSYKIEGDSLSILLYPTDKDYITKSGIHFLDSAKTSFTLINPKEKTEYTYKKISN